MGYTITKKKTGETVRVDTSTKEKKVFYDTLYHMIQQKKKEQKNNGATTTKQ